MTEHTPAPWTLFHNEKGGFTISDRTGLAVLCQRNDWDKRAAESIANARLIAAAPEMFALLKLALGDTEYVLSKGFWDEVRAVVAKAEGHPSR